jgi:proline dehydrogenase
MKEKRSRRGCGLLLVPFILALLLASFLIFQFGERWLRTFLIYLSHAQWARELVSHLSLAKKVARRFVAGETIEEAMAATRALNARGMMVTLDYLGESVTDEAVAASARDEILQLLDQIERSGLDANVSIKLSQLGLRIRKEFALENLRQLLTRAREYGNKIRIDMEESELVDVTLDIYHTVRDDYGFDNVGVVIQSYLYRSEKDVKKLIDEGAWVRLCKGAYAEPPDIAFPEKADTDANYILLMELMLNKKARDNGVFLGIATHDEDIVNAAIEYAHANEIPPEAYEFQMLYGIRRDLQAWLINQGYILRIYVPYGTAWYPYFVRRLAERPANLWFFVSNLFKH